MIRAIDPKAIPIKAPVMPTFDPLPGKADCFGDPEVLLAFPVAPGRNVPEVPVAPGAVTPGRNVPAAAVALVAAVGVD